MIGCCASLNTIYELKNADFSFIEVKYQDILNCKTKPVIPIYAINNLFPRNFKFFGKENNLREIKEITKQLVEVAVVNNVSIITLGCGRCRRSDNLQEDTKSFIKYLTFFNNLVKSHNIMIGIEPLSKEETNFLNNITQVMEIIRRGKFSNVGLTIDLYHMLKENDEFINIEKYSDHIVHVHIADENRDVPKYITPTLNSFLSMLEKANYRKGISIEIDWRKELKINSNIAKEIKEFCHVKHK